MLLDPDIEFVLCDVIFEARKAAATDPVSAAVSPTLGLESDISVRAEVKAAANVLKDERAAPFASKKARV